MRKHISLLILAGIAVLPGLSMAQNVIPIHELNPMSLSEFLAAGPEERVGVSPVDAQTVSINEPVKMSDRTQSQSLTPEAVSKAVIKTSAPDPEIKPLEAMEGGDYDKSSHLSHLSNSESSRISSLEDHLYSGNLTGVIDTVDKSDAAKGGSVNYIVENLKLKAFSECLQQTQEQCRKTFRDILYNRPDFELDEAELTHPIWGASFKAEKQRVIDTKMGDVTNAINSMNAHFTTPPKVLK